MLTKLIFVATNNNYLQYFKCIVIWNCICSCIWLNITIKTRTNNWQAVIFNKASKTSSNLINLTANWYPGYENQFQNVYLRNEQFLRHSLTLSLSLFPSLSLSFFLFLKPENSKIYHFIWREKSYSVWKELDTRTLASELWSLKYSEYVNRFYNKFHILRLLKRLNRKTMECMFIILKNWKTYVLRFFRVSTENDSEGLDIQRLKTTITENL